MSVLRTRKNKDNPYVMIDTQLLKREDVSLKAKGMHCYLISKPDDWQIYVSELQKNFKDGRDGVRAALNELEKLGYIEKHQVKVKDGRFKGWDYDVKESIKMKSPKTEKPKADLPNSENPLPLLKDAPLINENTNKKGDKKSLPTKQPSLFVGVKEYYFNEYERIHNRKPTFDGAQGKALKGIISRYSRAEIKKCIDIYLSSDDDFYRKQSYKLTYLLSIMDGLLLPPKEKHSFNAGTNKDPLFWEKMNEKIKEVKNG